MSEKILTLAQDLIRLNTVPEHPDLLEKALDLVTDELAEFTIDRFERNGVQSVLVHNQPAGTKQFKLLLNCHLDIIPAKVSQLQPVIQDGRLYGAGAMDMKANLASAVYAFKAVAASHPAPLALQLVTDEEVGGFDGTKLQVEQGVRADFVLATEPTNFDVVNQAKGVLWLRIRFVGTTAHGAYPWRGDNAILMAHEFLTELQAAFPLPTQEVWQTTFNVSSIRTKNEAFNKIPDDCELDLDIRFVPEEAERVLSTITALLPAQAAHEVLANESALATDKANPYIQDLQSIGQSVRGNVLTIRPAQGSSDARHFAAVGCPGIEFGPIGGGIGSDDEWVDIDSLLAYYEILCNLMKQVR